MTKREKAEQAALKIMELANQLTDRIQQDPESVVVDSKLIAELERVLGLAVAELARRKKLVADDQHSRRQLQKKEIHAERRRAGRPPLKLIG